MQLGARTIGGLVTIRVTTGGAGYSSAPSVTVSGGGGTGATAYCQMNGSAVQSICLASVGTGFTGNPTVAFTGGGGTGAAAVAFACTTSRPITFFKGRYADVYGVDGMGRGVRWDGSSTGVEPIGLNPPAFGPAVTSSSTPSGKSVKSIQLISAGNGYNATPSVVLTGGTPTTAAKATATIRNGQVVAIKVTEPGAGYQTVPAVSFSGGMATGATLTPAVSGKISDIRITNFGTSYSGTTAPTVTLHNLNGLTGALVSVEVDQYGRIARGIVLSAGTGATTGGITASISGAGTNAKAEIDMEFSVASVTVTSGGTGFYVAPTVTFTPNKADATGSGAAATAAINSSGAISSVTVTNGGRYSLPPTVAVLPSDAVAQAELGSPLTSKYLCCIRYLDDTPITQGGPIASSISRLEEADADSGAGGITWSFTHGALDDRVSAMELWRTTSDQSVILFRVATIARSAAEFTTSYTDTLSNEDLIDTSRDGYALMPITLPSGQINARRFGVPPGEFAVACMFQDRAWYAVDTTGQRPNTLVYSEIDEPESVPEANELLLQENAGEADKIVALIPVGGSLLIAQTAHLYRLTYVAQPVIDASVLLAANRGVLHNRCWASLGGVAFLVDSLGMYAFDGSQEESVSIAIDNMWRDGTIDFSKADKFHVAADAQTKTVRFYYCGTADSEPTKALCYCVATKAWWQEEYGSAITATCRALFAQRIQTLHAQTASNVVRFLTNGGTSDDGSPVSYSVRTGALALKNAGGSRTIDVLFAPTVNAATLNLSLHYNNASSPRVNAIASDRGGGFVTTAGGTAATLNLSKTRSQLGDASGQARAYYSGRVDDRSVGADRHVAVALSGQQSADPVVIHSLAIDGTV